MRKNWDDLCLSERDGRGKRFMLLLEGGWKENENVWFAGFGELGV